MADLAQLLAQEGACKLGHLNVECMHALHNSVSDLNLGKISCYIQFL